MSQEEFTSGLEFEVHPVGNNDPEKARLFTDKVAALHEAFVQALSTGSDIAVDVLTWSRKDAMAYAGEEGGERYDEDPDASVFDRLVITVKSLGRIA
jgi:hypothetical protein